CPSSGHEKIIYLEMTPTYHIHHQIELIANEWLYARGHSRRPLTHEDIERS
ncbi:hypothetical protein L9F63_006769, partial [Diploptera punctata]